MRKLLLLLGLVALAKGSPSVISGTLYSGDGTTTANGTVTIQWNNFTASDGHYVPAGSKIIVVSSGVFSQALEPGTNSAPHFSYRITYRFGSQPPALCTWVVGTSNAAIGDVETCPAAATSVPAANISLSQISAGGGSDGQCVVVSSGTLTSSACGAFWTQNVNDIYNSNTGNIGIGATPGNFKLDISKSGSTGTIRVYDQTATTGVTRAYFIPGAGQSSAAMVYFCGNTSCSIIQSQFDGLGAFNSFNALGTLKKVAIYDSQYLMASDAGLAWKNQTSIDTAGSFDLGLGRNAAGVLEINNGTLGTYRDIKARNLTLTGLSGSGSKYVCVNNSGVLSVGSSC